MVGSNKDFLRYKDLVQRGIVNNRQTLWRWINNHDFPPGVLIGPNSRAWKSSDVDEWIDGRPETKKRHVADAISVSSNYCDENEIIPSASTKTTVSATDTTSRG